MFANRVVSLQCGSEVLSGKVFDHRILDIKHCVHHQQQSSEMQLEILTSLCNIIGIEIRYRVKLISEQIFKR